MSTNKLRKLLRRCRNCGSIAIKTASKDRCLCKSCYELEIEYRDWIDLGINQMGKYYKDDEGDDDDNS